MFKIFCRNRTHDLQIPNPSDQTEDKFLSVDTDTFGREDIKVAAQPEADITMKSDLFFQNKTEMQIWPGSMIHVTWCNHVLCLKVEIVYLWLTRNAPETVRLVYMVSNFRSRWVFWYLFVSKRCSDIKWCICTLQEEHSFLTGSKIVLQWLSMRIFLKFSQNFLYKGHLKMFS